MKNENISLMGRLILEDKNCESDLLANELEEKENSLYIHYGSKEFDESKFQKIKNGPLRNKPVGGLWASPVGAKYGWKEWNEENCYADTSEDNSFKFTLNNSANILVISSVADVEKLPIQTFSDPQLAISAKLTGQMGMKSIDFELLKEHGFDAVELKLSEDGNLYNAMYGWDCDSIVILNPDVIIPILEKNRSEDFNFSI